MTRTSFLAKAPKDGQDGLSLLDHTTEVIAAGQAILASLPLEDGEFKELQRLLLPIWACHDWGKILEDFQKALVTQGRVADGYRHEVASVLLAASCLELSLEQEFAVITHHKGSFAFGDSPETRHLKPKLLFAQDDEPDDLWLRKPRGWLLGLQLRWPLFLQEIVEPLRQTFPSLPWRSNPAPPSAVNLKRLLPYIRLNMASPPYPSSDVKMRWALLRGLTIAADHLGSARRLEPLPTVSAPEPSCFLPASRTLYPYQEALLRHEGHLLLRAPTGSGKTEAIFCWLKASWRPKQRVFYTLPYTASANAMHRRLSAAFGSGEAVGILHSKAASYLFSLMEGEPSLPTSLSGGAASAAAQPQQRAQEAQDRVQLAREIFFPVKVCTPHQILRYSLRGKGWEMGLADLRHAAVIFDEFHAYDPRLTGFLIATARWLLDVCHARLAFLSATLPDFLRAILTCYLPEVGEMRNPDPHDPRDSELLQRKRHLLSLHEEAILAPPSWRLLCQAIEEGQRVLIVVNNVRSAQEIALRLRGKRPSDTDWPLAPRPSELLSAPPDTDEALPSGEPPLERPELPSPVGLEAEDVCLLHGAFHAKDRRRIEKSILEKTPPRVLVATQAIEVSLDIDYDVAFIENAPIDALIQRFGRVNRAGLRPPASIHVFHPSLGKTPFYPKPRLEATWEALQGLVGFPLREEDLIGACDAVYREGYQGEELQLFEKAAALPSIKFFQEQAFPGLQNPKWIDEILEPTSLEVLPGSAVGLCEEYDALLSEGRWIEARGLLVPIPFSLLRHAGASCARHERSEVFILPALDYTSELGAFLPPRHLFDDRSF